MKRTRRITSIILTIALFFSLLTPTYADEEKSNGFIWPSYTNYITSPFGMRTNPVSGVYKSHDGVDIGSAYGTEIWAAADGVVITAGWYGGYGNCVMIRHDNGYTTLYGHQSRLAVSVNDTVTQGQVIGYVGSTGNSTGPHLHFEIRITATGTPVNPLSFDYGDSSTVPHPTIASSNSIFCETATTGSFADIYGWDKDALLADEWDLSYTASQITDKFKKERGYWLEDDGSLKYTLKRSSQYGLDYYEDIFKTTKQYLGINDHSKGGGNIVQVALSQLGLPDSYEDPPNSNQVKYVDWYYGYHSSAAWCDIFVTWCADQCGYLDGGYIDPDTGAEKPLFNKANGAVCGATYRWFTEELGFDAYPVNTSYPYNASGYVPVPGDLMLFYSPDEDLYTHIGIVVEVTDSAVYVVEGNNHYGGVPGGAVIKMEYTYDYLKGYSDAYNGEFIHVIYPDVSGAAGVYNFLQSEFELNDAAIAGIMLSLYNESHLVADKLERGYAQGFGLWGATDSDYYKFYLWKDMRDWCIENGYSWITYEGQLNYLKYQLETDYPTMLQKLQNVPDSMDGLYSASMIWAVDHQGGGTFISASAYGELNYRRAVEFGAWPDTKTWAENFETGRSDHELAEEGLWNGQLFDGTENWSGQGRFNSPTNIYF